MQRKELGIAVIGAGTHRHAARAARRQTSVGRFSRHRRSRSGARARAGRNDRRGFSHRQQFRSDRAAGSQCGVRLDAGRPARGADQARARTRQGGDGRKTDRADAGRRRRHTRNAAAHRRRPAHRLQPPLQGMFSARQGTDGAGPARPRGRRHRARLQLARAGVLDPQALGARDAGGGRADLLRRSDVLVSRRQSAGGSDCARPARHLQGGRLRRARRDLGHRHAGRRRGDQSRRQLRAAGAIIRRWASRTASNCSAPTAP